MSGKTSALDAPVMRSIRWLDVFPLSLLDVFYAQRAATLERWVPFTFFSSSSSSSSRYNLKAGVEGRSSAIDSETGTQECSGEEGEREWMNVGEEQDAC